ncbi:SDR family NAD(P)-dependent oxidoreductase [Paenalkalicoccus suaedae]|uniref:SDR family NAD(P)-dependent oxidoreductase n=1 Tax=Paenalkalicoccus suaedae TaxID=2592382 RepID=A0A859FEK8_9BACI|nr:SDR family NAD(P)-dependent oxidoreductase [Paenalkalicoccus suaedae]QKS71278.1 SDR family NAD(P)-dependent oxidoreductase [Paenalkalicoccus suaedae]
MMQKVIVVTGCNSGFGEVLTSSLHDYTLVGTVRKLPANPSKHVDYQLLELTNQQDIDRLYTYIEKTYGRIDVLINNAGYSQGGVIEALTIDDMRQQFETNVFGQLALTKSLLPLLKKSTTSKIIMLSSISGQIGFPALGAYAASKFALTGFSQSLRSELLPLGITTSIIEAGAFKTNIWKKARNSAKLSEEATYKELQDYMMTYVQQVETAGADPIKLVKTVTRIIQAKKPAFRYTIGVRTKLAITMTRLFPATVEKLVLRRMRHMR